MDKRQQFNDMLEANNAEYSDQFDAYYNGDTGEWLEPHCSDATCGFCATRPDKIEICPATLIGRCGET